MGPYCRDNPCENRGNCIAGLDGPVCECEAGFQGDRYAASPDYSYNSTPVNPEDQLSGYVGASQSVSQSQTDFKLTPHVLSYELTAAVLCPGARLTWTSVPRNPAAMAAGVTTPTAPTTVAAQRVTAGNSASSM